MNAAPTVLITFPTARQSPAPHRADSSAVPDATPTAHSAAKMQSGALSRSAGCAANTDAAPQSSSSPCQRRSDIRACTLCTTRTDRARRALPPTPDLACPTVPTTPALRCWRGHGSDAALRRWRETTDTWCRRQTCGNDRCCCTSRPTWRSPAPWQRARHPRAPTNRVRWSTAASHNRVDNDRACGYPFSTAARSCPGSTNHAGQRGL